MAVSRRDRSTRLLVIGLILTSLMTITVDFRGGDSGPLAALGRTALAVIAPLQEGVSKVFRPIGSFFTDVVRIGSIKSENARLREKLAEVLGQQERLQQLERENAEYEELLGIKERLDFETTGATVIGENFSNFEWTIVIDRGSGDGLEMDMPVIAEGLVGRISRVSSSYSIVQLITDPNSFVSIRLSTSGEAGLLEGQRDQPLLLDLIDPSTTVEPGEVVETSGLGGESLFPGGIPVGEVAEVIPDESGLEQTILVRPIVDFSRLSSVLVVLSEFDVPVK